MFHIYLCSLQITCWLKQCTLCQCTFIIIPIAAGTCHYLNCFGPVLYVLQASMYQNVVKPLTPPSNIDLKVTWCNFYLSTVKIPPHMAGQKQDDQLKHTFSSYVRIWDVALKTYQRRWMIGRSGERGSRLSVLAARHDDDDC